MGQSVRPVGWAERSEAHQAFSKQSSPFVGGLFVAVIHVSLDFSPLRLFAFFDVKKRVFACETAFPQQSQQRIVRTEC